MSSFNDLVNLISSTFGNSLKPQFLQIANVELVKYINTGDRVKDGSFVIIANTFFLAGIFVALFGTIGHILFLLIIGLGVY